MKKFFSICFLVVLLSLFSSMASAQSLPGIGERGGIGGRGGTNAGWVNTVLDLGGLSLNVVSNISGFPVDIAVHTVLNVGDPILAKDAINKIYLDSRTGPLKDRISALEDFAFPAPIITNVNPTAALYGDVITITGSNFTGATVVTFGGGLTAVPTVVNDGVIEVVVPVGAQTGPVQVTTAGGTATSSQILTVAAPITVTDITPGQGRAGDTIVITGTGFLGAQTVTFPGGANASFTIVSDTEITTTVPLSLLNPVSGLVTVGRTGPTTSGSISFDVLPAPGAFEDIGQGIVAMGIPGDGLPIIALGNSTGVHVIKCLDISCELRNTRQLRAFSNSLDTWRNYGLLQLKIDIDGNPVIGWSRASGLPVDGYGLIRCTSFDCSTFVSVSGDKSAAQAPFAVLPNNNLIYGWTDIYHDKGHGVIVTCTNYNCSSRSIRTEIADRSDNREGHFLDVAIVDGDPLVFYSDYTGSDASGWKYKVKTRSCLNTSCSSGSTTSVRYSGDFLIIRHDRHSSLQAVYTDGELSFVLGDSRFDGTYDRREVGLYSCGSSAGCSNASKIHTSSHSALDRAYGASVSLGLNPLVAYYNDRFGTPPNMAMLRRCTSPDCSSFQDYAIGRSGIETGVVDTLFPHAVIETSDGLPLVAGTRYSRITRDYRLVVKKCVDTNCEQ